MFGSAILEVIVGLAFVYFLLAVIASHINEMIAGWLGWRSSTLRNGIHSMLPDGDIADKVWGHALVAGLGTPNRPPSYLPDSVFATALLDVVGSSKENWTHLPAGRSRDVLLSLHSAAGGDQTRLKVEIANWYNAAMDRVTGTYKRRIMLLTLAVGAALAVLFGVDTVALVTILWQDQALRAALSAGALAASPGGIEDTLNTLSAFDLPIGWEFLPQTAFGWFLKVIGLIVTALAISLGAPFWFDVIKKFGGNPRSSGPSPAPAQKITQA